ncbi:MAG: oxygenase MpaB family protein [Micropepsaceae bacterium]
MTLANDSSARPPKKTGRALRIDFTAPKGDPGLIGPGSVSWRVSANPIALAVGGIAAVILELAEPRVRAGVWDHSTFKVDPINRMKNTGLAAMTVTYGPTRAAEMMFARVTRMHERVGGLTHEGAPYQAMDDDLLTWVHVTAAWGFLNAYIRYVEPRMTRADQDRYYKEGEIIAKGFGAKWVPTSVDEVNAYMAAMVLKLYANDTIDAFLKLTAETPVYGRLAQGVQRRVVDAAIELVPDDIRRILKLDAKPAKKVRPLLRTLARLAGFALRFANGPQQQACKRMGVSTAALRPA